VELNSLVHCESLVHQVFSILFESAVKCYHWGLNTTAAAMIAKGKILVFVVIVAVLASSCVAKQPRKHRKAKERPTVTMNSENGGTVESASVGTPVQNASVPTAGKLARTIVSECLIECLSNDCQKCCHCVESVLNPGGVDVCGKIDCRQQGF